mmetsp:Transcript_11286/g.30227  ORF Transcript_11286/g.30227 Transcript_11286/m.30227 type:complete len:250 (+) Transcript_11286:434-1183(+)
MNWNLKLMFLKYTLEPWGVRRSLKCARRRFGKKTASASTLIVQSCCKYLPSAWTWFQAPTNASMLLMEDESPPPSAPPLKKAWSSHCVIPRPICFALLASSASELQKASVGPLSQQTTEKQKREVPCTSTPSGAFGTSRVPMWPRTAPSQPPGAGPVSQEAKNSSFFQQVYHWNSVNFQFGTATFAQHWLSMQFSPAQVQARTGGTNGFILKTPLSMSIMGSNSDASPQKLELKVSLKESGWPDLAPMK